MLSFGIEADRASFTASRSRGFLSGSGSPILAATVISFDSFENCFERTASCRPLRCWMFAHLEWPAMSPVLSCCRIRRFHTPGRDGTFKPACRLPLRARSGRVAARMTSDQIILFALFAAVFAALLWGRWRYDLIAFAALIVGVVARRGARSDQAFAGFGHAATMIVALVLVVSAGLVRSGAVLLITRTLIDTDAADRRPYRDDGRGRRRCCRRS